jgi:hypothetical protein
VADRLHVSTNYWGERAGDLFTTLVRAQHGVIAARQILDLGRSRRWIEHELAVGRLHPVYRGVYAVGHPVLTPLGRCMAAALAAGPSGALGFLGAAWLWGLADSLPSVFHVWCPTHRRDRGSIRFHQGLPADELTVHEGVSVTIPARTLLDLARLVEPHRLERMVEKGEEEMLGSALTYADLLERYPRKPGAPQLRRVLALRDEHGPRSTRSDPEAAFLTFCDRFAIPRPLTSYLFEVEGRTFELDAFWPAELLCVEYDSWEFHGNRASFRNDRIRDRVLATAGVRTVRATAYDLGAGAEAFAADIRRLREA